ncbi:MAG: hypothetical protein U0361_13160 [Nitrospiraceae bacterium]
MAATPPMAVAGLGKTRQHVWKMPVAKDQVTNVEDQKQEAWTNRDHRTADFPVWCA